MNTNITVITINLDNASGLERTLESIATNRDEFTEVVVIDGSSSDNSIKVIEEYKNVVDRNISEQDQGIYDAMNKGVAMSSGAWVIFINSGDELMCKLSEIKNELHANLKLVYGMTVVKNEEKKLFSWGKSFSDVLDIIVNPPFFHQAVFYNKKFIRDFSLEYPLIADRVMTYDILQGTEENSWKFIENEFASFCDGGVSAISGANILKEEREFLKNNGLLNPTLNKKLLKKSVLNKIKTIVSKTPFYTLFRKIWWRIRLSL